MGRLEEVLSRSWSQVVTRAKKDEVTNRTAATAIGVERVREGKLARGLFPWAAPTATGEQPSRVTQAKPSCDPAFHRPRTASRRQKQIDRNAPIQGEHHETQK
jgi:hypothetical protein